MWQQESSGCTKDETADKTLWLFNFTPIQLLPKILKTRNYARNPRNNPCMISLASENDTWLQTSYFNII